MEKRDFDVVILGGGPGGLAASIYAARGELSVAVVDISMFGGQPSNYLEIENYLGLGKISTAEMIDKFIKHVEEFKVPIYDCEEILSVDLENKIVTIINDTYKAKVIVIATGSRPRKLNVPGEKEFTGTFYGQGHTISNLEFLLFHYIHLLLDIYKKIHFLHIFPNY